MNEHQCNHCPGRYKLAEHDEGKQIRCPHCKQITVARPDTRVKRPPVAVLVQPQPIAAKPPAASPSRSSLTKTSSRKWLLWSSAIALLGLVGGLFAWFGGSSPKEDQSSHNKKEEKPKPKDLASSKKQPKPLPPEKWHVAEDEDLPHVVIQVDAWDNVMADLRVLLVEVGQEAVLDQMLQQFKSQNPSRLATLPGIDPTKPLGGYLRMPSATNPGGFVVLVPIEDERVFVGLLRGTAQRLEQTGADTYLVDNLPLFQKRVAVRFQNEYAYFAIDSKAIQADLVSPGDLFTKDSATFSATLRIDRIPTEVRKQHLKQPLTALAAIRPMMPLKLDGEGLSKSIVIQGSQPPMPAVDFPLSMEDVQQAYLDKTVELAGETMTDLFKGGRAVSLRLDLDRSSKHLIAEVSLSGRKTSRLANNIASVGRSPSLFGHMHDKEAAMKCFLHVSLPDGLKQQMPKLVNEITKKVLDEAENPTEGLSYEALMRSLGKTFAAGEADLALLLLDNGAGNPPASIGAVKLVEGLTFAGAFKKKMQTLAPDDQKLWKFDLGSASQPIYSMAVEKGAFTGWRQVFGDAPYYYGFRDEAMVFALGTEQKAMTQRTLDLDPTPIDRHLPSFLFELNLKKMLGLRLFDQPQLRGLAQQIFTQDNPGRVRVSLQGGDSLKARVELDLKLFAFMSQQAALMGNPLGQVP